MPKGFLSEKQMGSGKGMGSSRRCGACGLHTKCLSPRMAASGEGKKGVLVVPEAPGEVEDQEGTQLVGPSGEFTFEAMEDYGVDLDEDCRKINAINCHPKDNRKPTDKELESCRPMLLKEMRKYPPKVVILFGDTAVRTYLAGRWKKNLGKISMWRGWCIPDYENNTWVCPMNHPSYVLRQKGGVAEVIWRDDLQQALSLIDVPLPPAYPWEDCVDVIEKPKEIIDYLESLAEDPPEFIAFDFETTGLKPHRKGHEIVTCAVCPQEDESVAFPITDEVKRSLVKVLRSSSGKIAANMKFEESWSRVILNTRVNNWHWDTMQANHVLDNRNGITSMKFQAFIRWGVVDYASHLSKYMQSDNEADKNSFNHIKQAPMDELLLYNGMDSLLEYHLAMLQKQEMKELSE